MKGNGKPFNFTPINGMRGGHASFFATKSKITDGPAGGVVVPLPNGNLFMLGIRDTLLEQAAHQEVRRLADYKAEHGPMRKTVECVVTERALSELRLPPRVVERASKYGGYYTCRKDSHRTRFSSFAWTPNVIDTIVAATPAKNR